MLFVKLAILILLSVCLLSCETVGYYGQAAKGQFYILSHRVDISQLLESEETDPQLKEKLTTIMAIREFAEAELKLPVANNYSTYVDLQRPFVVWNVFATPEFSLSPINWCYPIAGCVSYRGYFEQEKALAFSDKLSVDDNYDIYVGGVAAYSTLGWFSDSVLNTVIRRENYQLASLIFHELAHQLIYIPGDTEFNESFATAVEQEGLRRWLLRTQSNESEGRLIALKAEQTRIRQQEFVALITETLAQLKQLYASEKSVLDMQVGKQELLGELRNSYAQLKINWDGFDGYDAWFAQDLNNAQLSTVATYYSWVPAFQQILENESNDLTLFYYEVERLQELTQAERKLALESYLIQPNTAQQ